MIFRDCDRSKLTGSCEYRKLVHGTPVINELTGHEFSAMSSARAEVGRMKVRMKKEESGISDPPPPRLPSSLKLRRDRTAGRIGDIRLD